jgi:aerobic-type carbon monoxide dehydrogenase small subunit (CoxS/CutS family)
MSETVHIESTINGRDCAFEVAANHTLLDVLRDQLGLTGTKECCVVGECGACTVLVDDVNHYACSMLTHSVRGRAVLTVEGLQDANGALHPIQQAFIDELAPQCGYCTPGQIMSAVALLKENADPTRDEVRHALSGNLCRCGAYDHYLNAVLRAAADMRNAGQIA